MKWVLVIPLLIASALTGAPPAKPNAAPPAAANKTARPAAATKAPAKGKASTPASSRSKNTKAAPVRLVAVRHTTGERGMSRSARSTRAARGGRYVKVSTPSYQTHPEPERYQQIQQALAAKGYFKGEANGTWGADSGDALKRYQADQKLTADGKINALTLTSLGLGPRHNATDQLGSSPLVPVVEPPPAPQPVPPPAPEPSGIPPAVTR